MIQESWKIGEIMSEKVEKKGILSSLLGDIWWMVLVRGIIMLFLGWTALTKPGITMVLFISILGVYWLIDGIVLVVESIKARKVLPSFGWGIFAGIMLALAGLIILVNPILSTAGFIGFIVFFVAFAAIFSGISSIINGIRLRKEIDNESSMIFGGIFALIIGILLMIVPPGATVAWFVIMIGIFAVIGGVMLMAEAFKIRKVGKELA